MLPAAALPWLVVVVLMVMAARQFMRARHPRVAGMQIGARDIALWSFLMSSAHGAGRRVGPVLLGLSGDLLPVTAGWIVVA